MEIQGVLTKVRYQNESKWGVYDVKFAPKDGPKTVMPFTGIIPEPLIGNTYTFKGDFVDNVKYGRQFKFTESSTRLTDTTGDGAYALLTSKRFPGVGAKKALAIVKMFGDKTLEVIKNDYKRLVEIPGIGAKGAKAIHDSMPDMGVWEELRMLLKGATDGAVNKIYIAYGDKAVSVIKENPYRLIRDVDGYGFARADAIAASVGIVGNNPLRVQAAVYQVLNNAAETEGHCFIYASNLQPLVAELVPDVSIDDMADAIKALTAEDQGRMRVHVDEDGAVYLHSLWTAETYVASTVRRLSTNKSVTRLATDSTIEQAARIVASKTGVTPDSDQQNAAKSAINHAISVITGGPGTGKTTIVRTIIMALFLLDTRVKIRCMAPTGRAARRMYEATGHEATTIHSIVYADSLSDADYVIVDECSMVDIQLAERMFRAIDPNRTKVILIGDNDQLPPIGPGTFFRDLLRCRSVNVIRLHRSYRNKALIASNSEKINNGIGVHGYGIDDTFQIVKANKEDGPTKAVKEYLSLVEEFGIQEAVLLAPTRSKGEGATNQLNKTIQNTLHPDRDPESVYPIFEGVLGKGDRVMLTKNYVIEGHANGDTGTVLEANRHYLSIRFDGDTLPVSVTGEEARYLILAYAISIHKSQGSEYNGVVVLLTSEHTYMAERTLLYTAVTRAKSKVRLVCDARTVATAVGKVNQVRRNSHLLLRLQA